MLGPHGHRRERSLGKEARSPADTRARGGGDGDLGAPAARGPQPRGRGVAGHGHRTHQRRRVSLPGHFPELRPGCLRSLRPTFSVGGAESGHGARGVAGGAGGALHRKLLAGPPLRAALGGLWSGRAPDAAPGAGSQDLRSARLPGDSLAGFAAGGSRARAAAPAGSRRRVRHRGTGPSGGGRLRDADRPGDARGRPGFAVATREWSRDALAVRTPRRSSPRSGGRRGVAPAVDLLGGAGRARRGPATAGASGGAGERRHVATLPPSRAARDGSGASDDAALLPPRRFRRGRSHHAPAGSAAARSLPRDDRGGAVDGGRSPLPLDLPLPIRRPPPDPGAGRPGLAVGLCGGPPGALLPARSRRLRIRVGFTWRSRSWWRHRLPSFRSA